LRSDLLETGARRKIGGGPRFREAWARIGRIADVFTFVGGLRWPWKFAIGAALCLPWLGLRLAAFGFAPEHPYFAFYPGVAMAAALGGWVAGFGAAVVSVFGGSLWSNPTDAPHFLLRFSGFIFYAAVVSALAEATHRAFRRLREAEGRRAAAEKLLVASERFRLDSADLIGTFDLDILNGTAAGADALRAVFGMTPHGVVSLQRLMGLAVPEDRPKIRKALSTACDPSGDGLYLAEYRIRRENDGAVRSIAVRGQVYFEAGRALRMIAVCRDITDVRSARQAAPSSEAQIRRFVEQAPTEIVMLDRDMNYVAVSARWLARYGKGRDSLVGLNHYAFNPEIPEKWKAIHRRVEAGEFHSGDGDAWVDSSGRAHWARWVTFPWTDSTGAIGGIIISAEDIWAQKEAEAALRESEEKFRNAFAKAAIGFVMAKAGGTVVEANEAFCRLTGYTPEDLKAMRPADFVHPEDRIEADGLAEGILRGEIPAHVIEHRYLRKDGVPIWVRESASKTHDAEGRPRWLVTLVEDVTERKMIEDSAARTVAQLTAVLDGAKDAIISIDIHGLVQSINAAGEKMFGYERDEVIGRNVSLLMPAEHRARHGGYIANYLATGVAKIIGIGREVEGRRKDGSVFPIELAITEAVVYNELVFVGFVRDLSERRRIESRIDQLAAQRLTAIGGMAGALAHELNQPLAAMGVYLETARRMLLKAPGQRVAQVEDAIVRTSKQVFRMGEIIGHLRDFVGHGEPDKTYQKLHALIEKVVAETACDGTAQGPALVLDLSATRSDVVVDPVQIGQVLANLVRNAREAVGEAPGGRVLISTSTEGDDMIRCDISDNGPGLAETVKQRLFEPLTSTKATGMGVGLSISKSIIEAHYGSIWPESNVQGGAVFSFTLPLAAEGSDE
jgi:PAS domain S-box-containing protein